MTEILNRAAQTLDFTGRTCEGIAYRYEYPSRVTDDGWATSYYEEILRSADRRTLSHRDQFPFSHGHTRQGGHPIGQVTFHRSNDERALMFRGLVDRGREGDAFLAEVDDWKDPSVGFAAVRNSRRSTEFHGPIVQRAEIRIDELAMCPTGMGLASGAELHLVRSADPVGTPRLDRLRRRRTFL